jgi:hypothetical protein
MNRRWQVAFLFALVLVVGGLGAWRAAAGPVGLGTSSVESLEFVSQIGGGIQAVALNGSLAYIGEGARLTILNVANPAAPAQVSYYDTGDNVRGVAVAGQYAYITDRNEVRILDVSNPAAPVQVGVHDDGIEGANWWANDVAVVGRYLYVAWGFGLRMLDVANPAAPVSVGFYDTTGVAGDVAVAGNLAYVADGAGGLFILRHNK